MPRPVSASEIEVVFETPPERNQGLYAIYREAVEQVKGAPGRWARIRIFNSSGPAYNARKGIKKQIASDERWEITIAKIAEADGQPERYGLWLRYRTPEQMQALKRQ
jgi:hypothetical protein